MDTLIMMKSNENIEKKMLELREIETLLGHLPSNGWQITDTSLLEKQDRKQMIAKTERLFIEICREMYDEDFSPHEISEKINTFMECQTRLKYCSPDEVLETLEN